ncbi:MAG: HEAT repeat domain-containing protein [Candidatus Zixiibacteriota bacterium]|nr:MAG: HEAT repeat domain-containing protein [candidate division Zixibacteria bacterium]
MVFIILTSGNGNSKVIDFTVLEKTRGSNLVVLAKCIEIEDEIYSIEYSSFPGKRCTGVRYGQYEIMGVWKGDYAKKFIRVDYKTTNEKYFPSDGCIIIYPPDGRLYFQPELDETVILFLEEENSIYIGSRGKVQVNESNIVLYRDAVASAILLDKLEEDEKVNMIFNHLEDDNEYINDSMRKEFIKIDKRKYSLKIAGLLSSENEGIKQLALFTLNGTGDTSVVSFVIPLLRDTSVYVRRTAADVLRRISDERTIPALFDSYGDPDPLVRRNVLFALSNKYLYKSEKYRDKAIQLFCDAVKDTSYHVRGKGVYALDKMSGQKVTECLLEALNDDSLAVRNTAIGALSSRGVPSIIELVEGLFFDGDPNDMEFALVCIDRIAQYDIINHENHLHIIRKLRDIVNNDTLDGNRSKAAQILGKINDPVFMEILPDLLNDEGYLTKWSAIHIMRQSKNPKYISVLENALKNETNENTIFHIRIVLEELKIN